MPERPKRRKNKNKRKNNKNFNTDVNKNITEEIETPVESCSIAAENITEPNETCVDEGKLGITVSVETSNISKDIKSDITQEAEKNQGTREDISSTSQSYAESFYKSSDNINSEIEQDKELRKGIVVTSKICPVLHEKSDEQNHAEKEISIKLPLSEVSALSKECLSNVIKINDKTEDILQTYIVEPPEQVTTSKTKCKLDNTKKSKSCDSDDVTTIVEITDDSNEQIQDTDNLPVKNSSNIVISGEDIEWENVNHFNLPETQLIQGILSSDTIPLNIVHCDEIKSLSAQEELSLRNYLQSLNLSTNPSNSNVGDIKTEIEQIINREIKYRLRKKGLIEDTAFIRAGPSRSLAVIDEEGSGDSSKSSRRHSYLSDKRSDTEELEDEVFECKPIRPIRCRNSMSMADNSNKRLIQQPCIRVDAKIKEPEVSEARGDWSVKTIEKMTGAELVYLTDSSSSTSSIYDINDDADQGEETDVSVRMITPTIEVTDTESLLSNTFLSHNNEEGIIKAYENICEDAISTADNLTKDLADSAINSDIPNDSHEVIVLSTDNIKTNLFVKDINETKSEVIHESNNLGNSTASDSNPNYVSDISDLEIKVLKCELNNAINNLIKEVISDSENGKETLKDTITRQDSSSSLDSSQCTTKYNPTYSSLNDVSNILQEDTYDNSNKEVLQIDAQPSHVNDVLQCIIEKPPIITEKKEYEYFQQPSKLKDICVKKITSFPFGDKILEELAQVSLRLQNMSALATERNQVKKNQTLNHGSQIVAEQFELEKPLKYKNPHINELINIPPPILPRKSSLKIVQDDSIKLIPPKTEPTYECLSPSQKMLMEKTNTTVERDFKSQPNVNISKSRNENEKNHPNIQTPIASMKSETGSRLLALLKDTAISNNLSIQAKEDRDLNRIPKIKPHSEIFSKRLLDEIDSANQYSETTSTKTSVSTFSSNSFKPLLPPKPKKLSTYFYESDEGSDCRGNSFRTMRSNKKYFHYSTGNLNKEIEDDISSIQNMHRYCTNIRDQSYESGPRRPSLPKDLCDQQMEYIRLKEKEVDAELRRLEQEQNIAPNKGPKAPMLAEGKTNNNTKFDSQTKKISKKDFTSQTHKNTGNSKLSSLFSSSQEELLREKMYSEYMNQMAEREQRKQQRVIKVTQTPASSSITSKSMPLLDNFDSKVNNRIEEEFISRARERWYKLGITDPETENKNEIVSDLYREPKVIEHKIKVIEAGEEKDVQNLPSHMQEFVKFTVKDKDQDTGSTGESNAERASTHVVVICAVMILVLTVGKFLLQLLRNK